MVPPYKRPPRDRKLNQRISVYGTGRRTCYTVPEEEEEEENEESSKHSSHPMDDARLEAGVHQGDGEERKISGSGGSDGSDSSAWSSVSQHFDQPLALEQHSSHSMDDVHHGDGEGVQNISGSGSGSDGSGMRVGPCRASQHQALAQEQEGDIGTCEEERVDDVFVMDDLVKGSANGRECNVGERTDEDEEEYERTGSERSGRILPCSGDKESEKQGEQPGSVPHTGLEREGANWTIEPPSSSLDLTPGLREMGPSQAAFFSNVRVKLVQKFTKL